MFTTIFTTLSGELNGIKRNVEWQNQLRETLNATVPAAATLKLEPVSLAALQSAAPDRIQWQMFDHCAAITRIYALFERAISELVSEYLSLLPKVQPSYNKLNATVRANYRVGVGGILSKWSADPFTRYSHLKETDLTAGLTDGLRNQPYSLLAEAMLTDTDNYRPETLKKLFSRCGFEDAFASVTKNSEVQEFCKSNLGTETVESYLNEFVRTRNEAAHGSTTTTASVNQVCNYADFVCLVVRVLASVLRARTIKDGLMTGYSLHIGNVIHRFSENVVGVKAVSADRIAVGDSLFAGSKLIEPVTVLNLKLGANEQKALALAPDIEFGLKLDRRLTVNSGIYRWKDN